MHLALKLGTMLLAICFSIFSYANNSSLFSESNEEYYSIYEKASTLEQDTWSSTGSFQEFAILNAQQFADYARTKIISLLKWNVHDGGRPLPTDPYARKLHFGRWINDPNDDTCMNTRARVLVRDSQGEITYRNEKNCIVDTGEWLDPYSGNHYETAKEIQIDHMVPLKNAYLSGAWEWDYKTRCLYANYMGYQDHLVPASAHENTSKGDRGPEKYLPPNNEYRCEYLKDWLSIKLIWGLTMSQAEAVAISNVLEQEGCRISDFKMTVKELNGQRKNIEDNIEFCMTNRRSRFAQ